MRRQLAVVNHSGSCAKLAYPRDARQWFDAAPLRFRRRQQHGRRGAVGDGRRRRGRHGAVLAEGGFEGRDLREVDREGRLVPVDDLFRPCGP